MHWIYLIIAVTLEVIGTTVMKWLVNEDQLLLGSLFVTLMVGLAYLALSQATSKIPSHLLTPSGKAWG